MNKSIYYPNLNGLRAIGALIVVFFHLNMIWFMWGLNAPQYFPINGKAGVALFFAISGFLITSLLFTEQDKTRTIKLKAFYIRRILRIWPLYYLILLLGIFVFNQVPGLKLPIWSAKMMHDLTWVNILSLLFIVPNFTHLIIPYTDQRWSIAVEELFYLVQPALVRTFRNKYVLITLFCMILFSPEIVSVLLHVLHLDKKISPGLTIAILRQLQYLGCIAIGCIFTALYKQQPDFCKKYLFSRWVQFGIFIPLIILFYLNFTKADDAYVDLRIYSFLFGIVVLNAALNPATIFRLEAPALNFLGKISYGIYMYHMFCLGIAFAIVRHWMTPGVPQVATYVVLAIGLTILVSWLSFRYIEKFFLGLNKGEKGKAAGSRVQLAEHEPMLNNFPANITSDNIRYPASSPVVDAHQDR